MLHRVIKFTMLCFHTVHIFNHTLTANNNNNKFNNKNNKQHQTTTNQINKNFINIGAILTHTGSKVAS